MAYTERYVTTSGTSGHGGTNDTSDAWDIVTGWQHLTTGIRLNIKAGTYTTAVGTSINHAGSGTAAAPAYVRGYYQTPGDLTLSRRANGDLDTSRMPFINTSADFQTRFQVGDYTIVEGLNMSGWRSNEYLLINGSYCYVYNCKVADFYDLGFSVSAAISSFGYQVQIIGCDVVKTGTDTGSGIASNVNNIIAGCKVTGGAGTGISCATSAIVVDCTIYNSTVGILQTVNNNAWPNLIANNTIYGCSTAGIQFANTAGAETIVPVVVNNHITDCGRALDNLYAGNCPSAFLNNRTRDNTSANSNSGLWPVTASLTTDNGGAESDYQRAADGNFVLAQRAVARGQSYLPNRDIGGVQSPKYRDIGGTQASRDFGFRFGS